LQLIGLFAGLCLAAAPSQQQMERGVDDFISRTPQRVSEPTAIAATVVQSVPVVQRTCASSARVEDLKAFFAMQFQKAGLWISPAQESFKPSGGEQISALDRENLISYTAILQPSGKLTTVVIAGANVGKPMVTPTNDAVAPVPPGSHSITSYRMEAVTGMTYQTPGTPAEVKQFYRDTLGKLGFKESGELMFVKDQTRVVLMVSPGLAERSVALYIDHPTPELMPPPPAPEKPAAKPKGP
jgi:hypothetical protein